MKKYVVKDAAATGQLLRFRRNQINLTLAELAAAVSVSLGTVQQWESGRRTPSSRFIPRLLSILKVTAADLGITETEITPEGQTEVTAIDLIDLEDTSEHFRGLYDCYESLNDQGKEMLLQFAEMLRTHPNYRM